MIKTQTKWPWLCAMVFAAMTTVARAEAPVPGLTPKEMRGLWFPKSDAGAARCAIYLSRSPVEPGEGALVVSETQMVRWAELGTTSMIFVTDVRPRRHNTWRIQGLLDVPPYEMAKVLETYVFEVRKDELLWSSQRKGEPLSEKVDTSVFVRCGY